MPITRHVVAAVDTVRKREHKALLEAGDAMLSKSKVRLRAADSPGLKQIKADQLTAFISVHRGPQFE